jgi:predicted O-linked N-acetylglucosamine transferase (SPINDLY family)
MDPLRPDHLAAYRRVDIALDTHPYNGTTTTCEALYMGVPVVTLAGRHHASRVGASLLHAVGLPGLVADSPDEYVRIAAGLAADAARRAELRASLRAMLLGSPLCDAPGFARKFGEALRGVWRERCRVTGHRQG